MPHLEKFVHTNNGRLIMSILLGFGLASLFRKVCNEYNCTHFYGAPVKDIENKIYRQHNKCVQYKAVNTKCNTNNNIVSFE